MQSFRWGREGRTSSSFESPQLLQEETWGARPGVGEEQARNADTYAGKCMFKADSGESPCRRQVTLSGMSSLIIW